MIRKIVAVGFGFLLVMIGNGSIGERGMAVVSEDVPPPVQVLQPQIEILEHPVTIEVQMEPGLSGLGIDTSMMILCATSAYRGELHVERQDVKFRFSIAGEIKELDANKMFVSFDVESQSDDSTGAKGLAGSGAAILEPGKPKTILTVSGWSVLLTVRLAE